jgi:hypothetical protein
MSVATLAQPIYPIQSGTTYPSNIDAAVAVLSNIAGDFAPSQAGATVTTAYQAGSITSGSPTVTGLASTGNIAVGQQVFGLGVPAGATVLSVDSASQVTLSANASSTTTSVLTFTQGGSPTMTVALAPAIIQGGVAGQSLSGALTSGSATVTGIPTGGLRVGQAVSGSGIPAACTILAIPGATSLTLSANATATNAAALLTVVQPSILLVGGSASGVTTSGSTAVTGLTSTAPVGVGMAVSGAGIPAGTTVAAITATGLTLSAAAAASGSVTLSFNPLTAVLTAPVANPRIDLVYADLTSGAVGVASGAEAASPVLPSLPANKLAVAAVSLTVGMTVITNSVISDLRSLLRPSSLLNASSANSGAGIAAEYVYAGNPNSHVAGVAAVAGVSPADRVWDTAHNQWWICTTTGTAAAAVWQVVGGVLPVSVASAATVDLGASASTTVNITGTTAITSLGASAPAGVIYTVIFGGALTLTYNAASLILPGSANLATAAGDSAQFLSLGAGNWKCIDYQAASGKPLVSGASAPGYFRGLTIYVVNATELHVKATNVVLGDGNGNYVTAGNISGVPTVGTFIWTTASGINGLDTGTVAPGIYYVYAASDAAGNFSGFISLSSTAPTLPSGYPFFARVGTVIVGSAGLLATYQSGRDVQYVVGGPNVAGLPLLASGASGSVTTPTWTAVSLSTYVPPTAAAVSLRYYGGSSGGMSLIAPNASYGAHSNTTNPPFAATATAHESNDTDWNGQMVIETTGTIYYAAVSATSKLFCTGWRENL